MFWNRHKHNWRVVSTVFNETGNGYKWRPDTLVSFTCRCGKAKSRIYKGCYKLSDFR